MSYEMEFTPLEAELDIISKLDDEPNDVGGMTSSELKASFDRAGNEIKNWLNSVHLPEVKEQVGAKIDETIIDIGAGDMPKSIYDTASRKTDIFGYVDEKVGGLDAEGIGVSQEVAEIYDLSEDAAVDDVLRVLGSAGDTVLDSPSGKHISFKTDIEYINNSTFIENLMPFTARGLSPNSEEIRGDASILQWIKIGNTLLHTAAYYYYNTNWRYGAILMAYDLEAKAPMWDMFKNFGNVTTKPTIAFDATDMLSTDNQIVLHNGWNGQTFFDLKDRRFHSRSTSYTRSYFNNEDYIGYFYVYSNQNRSISFTKRGEDTNWQSINIPIVFTGVASMTLIGINQNDIYFIDYQAVDSIRLNKLNLDTKQITYGIEIYNNVIFPGQGQNLMLIKKRYMVGPISEYDTGANRGLYVFDMVTGTSNFQSLIPNELYTAISRFSYIGTYDNHAYFFDSGKNRCIRLNRDTLNIDSFFSVEIVPPQSGHSNKWGNREIVFPQKVFLNDKTMFNLETGRLQKMFSKPTLYTYSQIQDYYIRVMKDEIKSPIYQMQNDSVFDYDYISCTQTNVVRVDNVPDHFSASFMGGLGGRYIYGIEELEE